MPPARGNRYLALDSLRGLAALTVVFHHFLLILPAVWDQPAALWPIKYTPLAGMWSGREAVMFFFVLSGFVLAIPFGAGKIGYLPFVVKRIWRIYPAYAMAALVSILLEAYFSRHGIVGLSSWFNRIWKWDASYVDLGQHLLLIDRFDPEAFNPALWSLVQEMRISLLFPPLMWVVFRIRWWQSLLIFLPIAFLSSFGVSSVGYVATGEFVVLFIFGALMAKHRQSLQALFLKLSLRTKWGILAAAVLAYTEPHWLLPGWSTLHFRAVDDWMAGIGACGFIAVALFSRRAAKVLVVPPLRFFGAISYSLYLFHGPLLFTVVYLLYGHVPLWLIWVVTFTTAVAVATLSRRLLEVPGIRAGHFFAARLSGKPPTTTERLAA